jgi:hypothetical protein
MYLDNIVVKDVTDSYVSSDPDTLSILENGFFSKGIMGWALYPQFGGEASFQTINEEMHVDITNGGLYTYSCNLVQHDLLIEQGATYKLAFDAYCDPGTTKGIWVKIGLDEDPWTPYSEQKYITIDDQKRNYCLTFTMTYNTDADSILEFQLGGNDIDAYFDNIVLEKIEPRQPDGAFLDNISGTTVSLGEQQTLIDNNQIPGFYYFPDMCVSVIEDSPNYKMLMTGAFTTFLVEGTSIDNLTTATEVLTQGGPGSFDNGYTGMFGVYDDGSGKIYGYYHAEDHEDMPDFANGIFGYHGSIALAESTDNGYTWTKLGQVITSSQAKGDYFHPWQFDTGIGLPSLTKSRDGEYLYMYYNDLSKRNSYGSQVSVARAKITDGPELASSWHKYYNGGFTEPALGGEESIIFDSKDIDADASDALCPFVTYSEDLDKYIMVVNINFWQEDVLATGLENSGIYISFSDDGINWTKPEKIITDFIYPIHGKTISWEPTIIWDNGSSSEGWLVYAYSENWGFIQDGRIPQYMVGRRISFQ